jgi:shikimate kinase
MELDTPALTAAEIGRIARRIDRPVVLVGMMGTGKSTVGRKLANMLGLPFVDADDEIERAAQMTIPEIFDTYGEPYFRDGERRVIARLLGRSTTMMPQTQGRLGGKIVATGGGAFCDAATRALILDAGIAVWLDSDVDTLVERVGRKGNRPLLRNGNPREILSKLREDRAPAYAQAPLHITSGQAPHLHTALSILKAIDAWL